MPEFDACYFCGIAVDAPIAEYHVVPANVDDEHGPIASLCPSCKGKLEKVLEPTVRRLDVPEGNAVVTLERVTEGDDVEEKAGGDTQGSTPAPTTDDSPDERTGEVDIQSAPDTNTVDDGIEVEPADGSHDDEDPGGQSFEKPDEQSASSSESATAAAESSIRDTDDTPERPETETYNRVVRLLQNREFPVDRSEFETLASSAYDVSPAECERVIEYAIYRGELDEHDGLLQKPEEK